MITHSLENTQVDSIISWVWDQLTAVEQQKFLKELEQIWAEYEQEFSSSLSELSVKTQPSY